ncbi:hypothetical protein [Haloferula sp.]|uniref:hypothetical protein n=1 Tax=Haloferula sp. TaxID=2497595 RepID=UPI00329B5A42
MKVPLVTPIIGSLFALLMQADADIYVTNFNSLNGGSGATGVWRNITTATDLTTAVSLGKSDGMVQPQDGSEHESRIDDLFQWRDDTVHFTSLFEPNFDGDFINVAAATGVSATVIIGFNAEVVDPTLHFTDIGPQTTLQFLTSSFVKTGGLSNMEISGVTVSSSGDTVPLMMGTTDSTLGSLKFTGTFTALIFTITNSGSDPIADLDYTGFVVSTEEPPVSLLPPPELTVSVEGDVVTLDWGTAGAFSEIQMLNDSSEWVGVIGTDPAGTSSYEGSKTVFGPTRLFRGIY